MDQEQFARYLGQGLGRPNLWLRAHDSTPYADALLHACLYNPCYDRQCEGSRTDYLYELVLLANNPLWFRRQLLDALADPDAEMDLDQLFDFALLYARTGDANARHILYEQSAAHAASGDSIGADQLIDLDGVEGFLFITNRLGEAMQSDAEFWDDDHLLLQLEATGVCIDIAELRIAARDKYPFAPIYLDHIVHNREQRHQAVQRPQLQTYIQVKQQIEQNGRLSVQLLRRWGRAASDEEIRQAAHDLLQETDLQRLARYLAIFGERAFPLGFEPLLPFVWHNNERIARWSIQAISHVQHPAVRELGFTLIQAQQHTSDALDVFIHHYQHGDERYLAALLAQTTDVDELHGLGGSLDDIFTQHPTSTAADIFLDLYERGPCSLCRERFVQRLIDISSLPEWLRDEGLYDANFGIREAMKTHLH